MGIKVKFEIEEQPIKNLWNAARNAENPSIHSKETEDFISYLNMLVDNAFKDGRNFQKNLKADAKY